MQKFSRGSWKRSNFSGVFTQVRKSSSLSTLLRNRTPLPADELKFPERRENIRNNFGWVGQELNFQSPTPDALLHIIGYFQFCSPKNIDAFQTEHQ